MVDLGLYILLNKTSALPLNSTLQPQVLSQILLKTVLRMGEEGPRSPASFFYAYRGHKDFS